jgi:hypothetical protein
MSGVRVSSAPPAAAKKTYVPDNRQNLRMYENSPFFAVIRSENSPFIHPPFNPPQLFPSPVPFPKRDHERYIGTLFAH